MEYLEKGPTILKPTQVGIKRIQITIKKELGNKGGRLFTLNTRFCKLHKEV